MENSRWIQRFENFNAAFSKLEEAVQKNNLNELEENGLIQRFEFTIEIAWKTLRDFLIYQGYQTGTSPKEVFRFAAKEEIIQSAEPFFNCLETRNQLSHDYSQSKFKESVKYIREDLFPHLKSLRDTLHTHLE
jgi:nucleotidyltransferase substrate binding protein (TIGR01987 family)